MTNENIETDQEGKEIEGVFQDKEKRKIANIRLDKLFFGELNERLEPGDLEGLAASIKAVGVLEPLVVRPVGDRYEIIAGGRRFRAAGIAGLSNIPCQIKTVNDLEALQISFQENEERKSASPLEYGLLCWKLANRIGDLKEVAARLGKHENWVSSRINAYELWRKAHVQTENKSPAVNSDSRGISDSIGIVDSNMIMEAVTSRPINRYVAQCEGDKEEIRTTFIRDLSDAFPKLDPYQKRKLISEFKKNPNEQVKSLTSKVLSEQKGIKMSLSFNAEISIRIKKILSEKDMKPEDWIRELVRKEISKHEEPQDNEERGD